MRRRRVVAARCRSPRFGSDWRSTSPRRPASWASRSRAASRGDGLGETSTPSLSSSTQSPPRPWPALCRCPASYETAPSGARGRSSPPTGEERAARGAEAPLPRLSAPVSAVGAGRLGLPARRIAELQRRAPSRSRCPSGRAAEAAAAVARRDGSPPTLLCEFSSTSSAVGVRAPASAIAAKPNRRRTAARASTVKAQARPRARSRRLRLVATWQVGSSAWCLNPGSDLQQRTSWRSSTWEGGPRSPGRLAPRPAPPAR